MKQVVHTIIIILTFLTIGLNSSAGQKISVFPQKEHLITISNWDKSSGLPNWNISDLIQTKKDLIWMATTNGLTRFDGREFTHYEYQSCGFRDFRATKIWEDVKGNIWVVGERSNGKNNTIVDVFDPYTKKAVPFETYLGQPFYHNTGGINILAVDGIIWVFDFKNGKGGRYDGKWAEVLLDSRRAEENRTHYIPAPNGKFWAKTRTGYLQLIDSEGKTLHAYPKHFGDQVLMWINEGYELWISEIESWKISGTLAPVFCLNEGGMQTLKTSDLGNQQLTKVYNLENKALVVNQKGIGWLINGNLVNILGNNRVLDIDLGNILHQQYQTKINYRIYRTRDESFWIANQIGLFRIVIKHRLFTTYLSNLPTTTSVRGMAVVNGNTLLANTYQGPYEVNIATGEYKPFLYPSHNQVGLGVMSEGKNLWIGHYSDGATRYDFASLQFETHPFLHDKSYFEMSSFHRLNDSTLLAGTIEGVFKLNMQTGAFEPCCLADQSIYCWYENEAGLWAGTSRGVVLFDRAGHLVREFSTPFVRQGSTRVRHIHQDSENYFWMATAQGLCKWIPFSDKAVWYDENDGFPDDGLHCVYEDTRGYLWLTSNTGLLRFHRSRGLVEAFSTEDGLPANEFNGFSHYRDARGNLFFGGINGLISFHPDSIPVHIQIDTLKPQLLYAYVYNRKTETLSNRTREVLSLNGVVTIFPYENRIEMGFTAPLFKETDKVYEWKIAALGNTWKQLKEPFLQLNALPYGQYTLEIRARKAGFGLESAGRMNLILLVKKPFYWQWWFWVIVLFGLLGGIKSVMAWRHQYLTARNLILEQEVIKKTAQLRRERETIAQQAEQLQQLDEMKSNFFINVSHEFRTPLTLILGPLKGLIQNKEMPAKLLEEVQGIRRNALKIQNLTDEILDLARLDAGKLTIEEVPVQFEAYINRIVMTFHTLADSRGISLTLDNKTPESLLLTLDPGKVEKVLNNLITNALKFTPSGGAVAVTVVLLTDMVEISVKDTGIGINQADLGRIFDRYFQVKKTGNTASGGGLGVGLALSQEYAKLMNGSLIAESHVNKGTQMIFRFPRKEPDVVLPVVEESSVVTEAPAGLNNPPQPAENFNDQIHLLLVEDNREMLQYLVSLLAPYYRVSVAQNGQLALAELQRTPVDLIISDVMMPEMDGFTLLRKVREAESAISGASFIMLTARVEMRDQLDALHLGVDAYLTKPFEPEELLARVANLVTNQQLRKKALTQKVGDAPEPGFVERFSDGWLRQLEVLVNAELHNSSIRIPDIASRMAMSERTLRDKIKAYTGLSPQQYILEARMQKALRLLENGAHLTIAETCYAVGINTPAYFAKVFKERFGKSPSDYFTDVDA